jgi:catechol 2,3-dioxygenase-like lactoylglutathione lyase family enzyme
MTLAGLQFAHLGLAVKSAERAHRFLTQLGYTPGVPVQDDAQNVNLSLCTHPSMPAVELIWPTETPGPLDAMLKQHAELAYHLAYEVPAIDGAISALKAAGHRVLPVTPQRPAVLFGLRKVAFYRVAGVGLVELIEAGGGHG